jgi:hypothetical protein
MLDEADLEKGQLRLLETDNRVILPVGAAVRILVTAVMFYTVLRCLHLVLKLIVFPAV